MATPTDAAHAISMGIRYGTINAGFPNNGSAASYDYFTDIQWQWVPEGVVWPVAVTSGEEEVSGGHITIGTTAPSAPAINDIWIDTT